MWWLRFKLIFCLVIPTWTQEVFPNPSRVFQRSEVLVPDRYRLLWSVSDRNITIEVQAATKGWVGLGLSPNGGMVNSDVVTGWVKDGTVYFQVI